LYYFENSRNGGGDVKKLEYEKEARAIVFFEDPSGLLLLMKMGHALHLISAPSLPNPPPVENLHNLH
jgi:hypothetical protein